MTEPKSGQRILLTTITHEPFQPVRLYYSIPSRTFALARLDPLECVVEAPAERCWHWLFHAESASIRFDGSGYDDVPVERRPIILGRLRFPRSGAKSGGLVLETNSFARALAAARFFAPLLGEKCIARRCRVLNRFCANSDGTGPELFKLLDQDVTIIDPRVAEERLGRRLAGARTLAEVERRTAADQAERRARGDDVPLVEDFPLAPEEETPDFRHLETTLQLRLLRAHAHWGGDTTVTLQSLILELVRKGSLKGDGGTPRVR